ncbi:MAG: acyltransferase [Candidatus Amulumruptor caecigallinarius]|nr:acyltransferase [Candidatus Amulumruptor caecigallinarius]MCM1396514.1 acyltransferase [Candidatus Amulumruptor caecigallinarius]MCM1453428.1 acyltransferase [bacterium]
MSSIDGISRNSGPDGVGGGEASVLPGSRGRAVHLVWVDYAKVLAVAIVLVVHLHYMGPWMLYMHLICMPMLFMLSGYLFSYRNNPRYGAFALKRTRQLLVPYVWIGVLAFGWWVKWTRQMVQGQAVVPAEQVLWEGLVQGHPGMMGYDLALWALLALYIAEMAYWPLARVVRPWVLAVAGLAAGALVSYLLRVGVVSEWPLCLSAAVGTFGYYALGHSLRLLQGRCPALARFAGSPWLVIPFAGLLYWSATHFEEVPTCVFASWVNEPWYIVGTLSGAWLAVILCRMVAGIGKEPKWCKFVSVNSLLLCCLHLPVYDFWYGVIFATRHLYVAQIDRMPVLLAGILAGTLAIILPLTWLIRRYARWLVDK